MMNTDSNETAKYIEIGMWTRHYGQRLHYYGKRCKVLIIRQVRRHRQSNPALGHPTLTFCPYIRLTSYEIAIADSVHTQASVHRSVPWQKSTKLRVPAALSWMPAGTGSTGCPREMGCKGRGEHKDGKLGVRQGWGLFGWARGGRGQSPPGSTLLGSGCQGAAVRDDLCVTM